MAPLLLLVASAHAMDLSRLQGGGSIGYEALTNDPFLNRRGVRFAWHVNPAPWAEIAASVAYYPVLGSGGESDPDWKPLSKQLLLKNSVSPDLSKLLGQAQWVARVYGVRYQAENGWIVGFGGTAGVALFSTQEDLVALQNDGPEALATQNQVHVGPVGGFFWEVRAPHVGVRMRFESDGYIETVTRTTLEMKNNAFLGAEVMFWF